MDSERGNSPVIIMNSEFLVCLADKMATHLGPEVLRTLRFAASDEWRETLEQSCSRGRDDPENGRVLVDYGETRAITNASIILDGSVSKYVIETTVPTPIAAGNLAAALEFAIGNPIRVGGKPEPVYGVCDIQIKERAHSDTSHPRIDNLNPRAILHLLYRWIGIWKERGASGALVRIIVVPIPAF